MLPLRALGRKAVKLLSKPDVVQALLNLDAAVGGIEAASAASPPPSAASAGAVAPLNRRHPLHPRHLGQRRQLKAAATVKTCWFMRLRFTRRSETWPAVDRFRDTLPNPSFDAAKAVGWAETKLGFTLAAKQKEAIALAVTQS